MSLIQDLKDKMQLLGIQPKKSLGQNFLVSPRVIEQIIERTKSLSPGRVFEIGPGLGALTESLSKLDQDLTLLELDSKLSEYWRGRGLKVVEGDALKLNWSELTEGKSTLLVSNLPYQISSSLVIELSLGPSELNSMILMFQKEVAQRIRALPKTSEYGMLSVVAQTFWDIETLLNAAPQDFYPPPQIASRVLTFHRISPQRLKNPKKFLSFVKAAFAQRRKFLKKNLKTLLSSVSQSEVLIEEALTKLGLDHRVRAEELSRDQFIQLYEALIGD